MSAADSTQRRKLRGFLAALIVAAAVVFSTTVFLTSSYFQEAVRHKVIADLEQITGGKVEIGAFRWNLARLQVEADDLTVHGSESPTELPFAHADHLFVSLKVVSLLRRDISLQRMIVDKPVIHIIVNPDGSRNQPAPMPVSTGARATESPVTQLFNLAVRELEVRNGAFIENDRALPLDFSARDLHVVMDYAKPQARYDGQVELRALDMKYGPLPQVLSHAQVGFRLWRDHADLTSLHWQTDRSSIDATGTLANFNHPQIDLQYTGSLDLSEVAALAHLAELRAGKVDVAGQGKYRAEAFSTSGHFALKDAEYRDRSMRLAGASGEGQYQITPDRVNVTELRGRGFGGAISGAIELRNWSNPQPGRNNAHARLSEPPAKGSAHLRFNNLQIPALITAFPLKPEAVARLKPVGSATGTLDATWTGRPSNADLTVALDTTPPAQPAPDQMPITAVVRAKYSALRREIDVPQLNIAARSTRFSAAGVLGSTTAHLNVSLNTTNLAELQPLLASLGQGRIPVELHGPGSFNGVMIGNLPKPTITGRLEVKDFDYLVAPRPAKPPEFLPVTSTPNPQRIRWDSLAVDVQLSPTLIALRSGTLKGGKAVIAFEGHADLRDGEFADDSHYSLKANIGDGDVSDLLSVAGLSYPITGKVALNVNTSGTRHNSHGAGALDIRNGTIYGESFQRLHADIRIAGSEAILQNLLLSQAGAKVQGTVAYDFASQGFRVELSGDNFDLAKIRRLQSQRIPIGGLVKFHITGSGTRETPNLRGDLSITHLVLSGEPAGDVSATAETHGANLALTARSSSQSAVFALDGNVFLRDDFPASGTLKFAHLDIDSLLKVFVQGRITGHSQIAGSAELRGPLRRPHDLNAQGEVDQFSAEVEKVKLASEGPIKFRLHEETFTVDRLHLVGEGTDIVATGTASLAKAGELNFRVDGKVNLALLRTFNRDIRADGLMQIDMAVTGTPASPDIEGQVRMENGSISYVDMPNGLSNINGTLVFNQNRLRVQSLTAYSGGGILDVGGFISFSRGLYFDLTLTSKDIRLRYPPGVSAAARADLRLAGSPTNSLLSGDITVSKFGLTPQFDIGAILGRNARQPGVGATAPNSVLNNLHLDIHIVTTPELEVQTSLARLSGDADLHLRGTAGRPVVLGRIEIAQGYLSLNGTKYHVERGEITFSNPTGIVPVANLEATTRVREYDISLGFHGPLESNKLTMTYRSDPPLPESDIIALLALGRTREDAAIFQPNPTVPSPNASSAILGAALESAQNTRMQKLFGISRIKIDPQAFGPEGNPSSRVTIEQPVSDKVTLTFISNVSQSAQQIIQVEYRFNRRLSVLGTRDQNGVLSFDVIYRQRKR
jgi:translocation and assembly module TamB